MSLETVTHISDLVITNPTSGDPKSQGDDHFRNVKNALRTDFPNISGVVTATHTELSLLASGTSTVIGRAYSEYTTNTDITAVIPGDDTIPQNTEGTQILSVSYTPKSATNRIRVRFDSTGSSGTGAAIAAALFTSASASAVRANLITVPSSAYTVPIALVYEYVPGTTSAITYTIRVGPVAAGTIRLNGNNGTRFFGGTMASTLIVEEIVA